METCATISDALQTLRDLATPRARLAPAFSLIEILVTTALLSFIIVGLVAMFSQTQRAFTQSLTDVDLLENGRAVMELVARDLAEAAPANLSNAVNFYAEIPGPGEAIYTPPLFQGLPGTVNPPQLRMNYLQPFYFLSHPNQMWPDRAWAATGYYVVPDVPGAKGVGIGTLYRFAATNAVPPLPVAAALPANVLNPGLWGNSFVTALSTLRTDTTLLPATAPVSTVTRIADGVVHLSVRLFATNGFPIVSDIISGPMYGYTAYVAGTNSNGTYLEYARPLTEVTNHLSLAWPDSYDRCWFYSNALPACVELELQAFSSARPISVTRPSPPPTRRPRLSSSQTTLPRSTSSGSASRFTTSTPLLTDENGTISNDGAALPHECGVPRNAGLSRNAFRKFKRAFVPEGHHDNSPAFQRWDRPVLCCTRPEGTAESVEWGRRAYQAGSRPSLRDLGSYDCETQR